MTEDDFVNTELTTIFIKPMHSQNKHVVFCVLCAEVKNTIFIMLATPGKTQISTFAYEGDEKTNSQARDQVVLCSPTRHELIVMKTVELPLL